MKRIVKISLILFIMICITGNVHAMTTCGVDINILSTEVIPNDKLIVEIKLSNVQTDSGIDMFQATLSYDDTLTLEKMEGLNNWKTPKSGSSYNPANGVLILDKSGSAESDEEILKLTFKVKENASQNISIALSDARVSDGDCLTRLDDKEISVNVKNETPAPATPTQTPEQTPNTTPEQTPNQTPNTTPEQTPNQTPNTKPEQTPNQTPNTKPNQTPGTNSSTSGNKDTDTPVKKIPSVISEDPLPKAGDMNAILLIAIGILIIISGIFYIRFRNINK